jgi:hypothetical protein
MSFLPGPKNGGATEQAATPWAFTRRCGDVPSVTGLSDDFQEGRMAATSVTRREREIQNRPFELPSFRFASSRFRDSGARQRTAHPGGARL